MKLDVKGFSKIESDLNLFDRQYNGEPYWQFVRFTVFESIFSNRVYNKNQIRTNIKKLTLFKKLIKGYIYSWYSTLMMCFIGKHELICFKADKLKDRFYDYWKMPEDINSVFIRGNNEIDEFRFSQKYNILSPYIKANTRFELLRKMRKLKIDGYEYRFLQEIEKVFTKKYGRCISADYMQEQIQRYILYKKYYIPFFEKLFDKVKCKAIMVVWYYQMPMMIAYQVAKKRSIQIIELQHGVINNHQEYWFEDQRGINNNTPDYFLAFGKQHILWTKMLKSTLCLPVGYPYQEFMVNQLNHLHTESNLIIIYPESNDRFETLINEFVNRIVEDGYRILMKLHPLQSDHFEIYYPILSKNKHIQVITDQSKGIYYWLKLGKHHIMANTTVGHEALVFPHTNICIATNVNHEQMQPLLDWNLARGFDSVEQLIYLIKSPSSDDMIESKSKLWEPEGEKKIIQFLINMKQNDWPSIEIYKKTIGGIEKCLLTQQF